MIQLTSCRRHGRTSLRDAIVIFAVQLQLIGMLYISRRKRSSGYASLMSECRTPLKRSKFKQTMRAHNYTIFISPNRGRFNNYKTTGVLPTYIVLNLFKESSKDFRLSSNGFQYLYEYDLLTQMESRTRKVIQELNERWFISQPSRYPVAQSRTSINE
ncbi:hypothetical protein GQX74_013093 [Glossina fuscipes]|nr:hypothetical protein GQX74_013093 [Glossina fuscipes]